MTANQIACDLVWRNSFQQRHHRQMRLRQLKKLAWFSIPFLLGFAIGMWVKS